MSKSRVPATPAQRRRPQAPTTRRPGTPPSRNRMLAIALAVAALIAAVLIGVSVLGGNDNSSAPTSGPAAVDTSVLASLRGIPQRGLVLGRPSAKATIVEYGDLQCPACQEFASSSLPTVVERWVKPGRAKLEFRGLDFLGDDSTKALRFVLAAAEQDKAWSAIELFYANQGTENSGWVTDDLLRAMATALGLDPDRMVAAASATGHDAAIARAEEQARSDGLSVTPTFVVRSTSGSTKLEGAQPADAFAPAIEAATSG